MDGLFGVDAARAQNDAAHVINAIVANASYACQPVPVKRHGKSSLIEAFSKKYATR